MADIISFADYVKGNNKVKLDRLVDGTNTADIDIQYEKMKSKLSADIRNNKEFLRELNIYLVKMCFKLGEMYAEQFNTHPDLFGDTLSELLTKNKTNSIMVKAVKEQMKKDGCFIK